jgi:hypothetical protein
VVFVGTVSEANRPVLSRACSRVAYESMFNSDAIELTRGRSASIVMLAVADLVSGSADNGGERRIGSEGV